MPRHVIIHDPHSATTLHPKLGFAADPRSEVDLVTDWHVGALFAGFPIVSFAWSRLCCDVERLRPDPSADKRGQGVLYERTIAGSVLRRATPSDRSIANALYEEHHRNLERAIEKDLCDGYEVLLVDAHSYSDRQARLTGSSHPDVCPDVCIGFNDSNPPPAARVAFENFASAGLSVAYNLPFAGTMMPLRYGAERKVGGVMLELHKRLYLRDSSSGDRRDDAFGHLQALIRDIVPKMTAAEPIAL